VALTALVILGVSSLPYLVAWAVAPEGAHFTGILVNPIDGHSYLAKMRQGWEGSWRFRLAFTPEVHEGAPIYLFYLGLGHVARWMGLSLILVYHLARGLGGAAMLVMVYVLVSHLNDNVSERRTAFLLVSIGSGLGWLTGLFGMMATDLWVPEAFPWYALLGNAHFPMAIALMLSCAVCGLRVIEGGQRIWMWGAGMVLGAIVLGGIQPFGLVAVFGGLGMVLVHQVFQARVIPWRAGFSILGSAALALPYPIYIQVALLANPVLRAWNEQNVTPSPPFWHWLFGYGLMGVLAGVGIVTLLRQRRCWDWFLLGWVVVVLIGMYVPLSLQRRLSLGLSVPIGVLAEIGWRHSVRSRITVRWRKRLQSLLVAFCAVTPIFFVSMLVLSSLASESWFYLSDGEWDVLRWLRDEGRPEAVVLCSPMMGTFTPAWAGQPVLYGHPFETVNAEQREAQVEAFWTGALDGPTRDQFLRENRVTYILAGPREAALAGERSVVMDWLADEGGWRIAFEAGAVKVYEAQ